MWSHTRFVWRREMQEKDPEKAKEMMEKLRRKEASGLCVANCWEC